MNKLSNLGYSQHLRLLKLNHKGLSYYKHVPADFNDSTMSSDALQSMVPKKSIPIGKIIMIEEITDADKKTYKKFYKAGGVSAFKVIFEKKSVEKGRIDGDSESSDEDNSHSPEVTVNEDKKQTWFFSISDSAQGPKIKDWLLNTSLYCIKVNKKFAASTDVRHRIEQEKEKLNRLKGVTSPKPDQM